MFEIQDWRARRFGFDVLSQPLSRTATAGKQCEPCLIPAWLRGPLAGSIAALLVSVIPAPSRAAEKIEVSFKDLLEIEIPVSALESFVMGGPLPRDLEGISGFVGEQQFDSARELLTRHLDIEVTVVSQFFSLPEGELVLNRIAQLLKEQGDQDTLTLLRQALFRAASDNQGLSLLSVVKAFPSETLAVDLEAVLRLVAENAELYSRRATVFEQLWSQIQQPSDTLPLSLTRDLRQPGLLAWQKQTLRFQNPSRVGSSPVDVYLPQVVSQNRAIASIDPASASEKTPVIVISHGLGSNRQTFAYLARHLVSYGFAVVVLEHTDTNTDRFSRLLNGVADPPPPTDLINRPRDISAVLDELMRRAKVEPKFANLDVENVGVVGQSLGGYTALAAGGATIDRARLSNHCSRNFSEELTLNLSLPIQCRILDLPEEADLTVRDDRVKAVMAMNPLTSQIFGPQGLGRVSLPVMMVASTEDYFAPTLAEQIDPFRWLASSDKYLLVVKKATHFSFLDNPEREGFSLPAGLIGPEPQRTHSLLEATSVAFFERYLRIQSESEQYLSEVYVADLVEQPFSAAIVRSLSALEQ